MLTIAPRSIGSHRKSTLRSAPELDYLKQIHTISGEHELILTGDHNPWNPMSENTVNNAFRLMGYDAKLEVCGHNGLQFID